MAQFSINAQRLDPYKNFKFRVQWDGRFVAGVVGHDRIVGRGRFAGDHGGAVNLDAPRPLPLIGTTCATLAARPSRKVLSRASSAPWTPTARAAEHGRVRLLVTPCS